MPFGGLLTAGIIGAVGTIGGAAIGAGASKKAADLQYQSSQNALDFQKQAYADQQKNAAPFLKAGTGAVNELAASMPELTAGFDPTAEGLPSKFSYGPSDFQQDPGFQFALEQGQRALDHSMAAKGQGLSGGAIKAGIRYATGMADQQYNEAYNRAQGTYQQNYANAFNRFNSNEGNRFNRLAALVGVGQTANGQAAGAAQNFANNAGNYAVQGGNALAAGAVGSANAWSNGLSGVANMATNLGTMNMLRGSSYGGGGYGGQTINSAGVAFPSQNPADYEEGWA